MIVLPSNIPFPLPNDDRLETENDFGFDDPNSQDSEEDDSDSYTE